MGGGGGGAHLKITLDLGERDRGQVDHAIAWAKNQRIPYF